MAQTMRIQRTTGTATGRKAAVANVSRAVARPFTAQRPVTVAARASNVSKISRKNIVVQAAAATQSAPSAQTTQTKEWSAIVCSCDFFFGDTHNDNIAEQLRERVRFYKETNRDCDIFIVPEPTWLSKFPEVAKKVNRPSVALVSTDKQWITFMKLRIDRCLKVELKGMSDAEVLAVGGTVPEYKPPANWTAPYVRYTPNWWKVFLPQNTAKVTSVDY
ncbi:hypothetical protein Agub_g14854 [Astrephomene gubernaculifera]|uniref:Uncharacterized protein n=1 Tax=Astrephomene gubernaculifera TaxID=47775 RepID=A0AAD3E4A8_9CHLO|nr:hypothetical protein Agub_g14854 [Astrephomene gubernaculifera]